MALVNDNQIKEVRGELLVYVLLFFGPCDCLIQRQIDFIGLVYCPIMNLRHLVAKRGEVLLFGLVNKDVSIGKEKDAFLLFGFPQTPDDLECRVGFARSRRHNQKNLVLPLGNGFDGSVDGYGLVIAGSTTTAIIIVILGDNFCGSVGKTLHGFELLPKHIRGWELI